MDWIISLAVVLTGLYGLTRIRPTLRTATAVYAGGLFLLAIAGFLPALLAWILWLGAALLVLMNLTDLRRRYLSTPVLDYISKALPPISDTERVAIEAGTVWWEAELFRGNPDWSKLLQVPAPGLSTEEQAYLDGPVEQLCAMLDDWQITHHLNDLPAEVWAFMAKERFWAINIPGKYGGLEFSAEANSAIVMKVCSRSGSAGVTVMVPNSLGPAELLLHYGTEQQKDHYLPRLASGEEIPCFGLTNPVAGSDAGAIPDFGVVCEGEFAGEKVLGLRLNWEKRYITLGPVATLLGLAFKAYDPDHLLGDEEDLGITCALIPTGTPGVSIGNRHYPLNAAFQNGPNSGENVFIPLHWVIGGQEWTGQGMAYVDGIPGRGTRHIAARFGRSRSQGCGPCNRGLCRHSGTVWHCNRQIRGRGGTPGANRGPDLHDGRGPPAYYIRFEAGEKPSVITAIVKYHLTEYARQVIDDAMDIHGGRGICMGPATIWRGATSRSPLQSPSRVQTF